MKKIYLCLAAALILLLCSACGNTLKDIMEVSSDTGQESESATGQGSERTTGQASESKESESATGQGSESVTSETLDRTLQISPKDADRDLQTPSVQDSEEVQNLRRKMEDFCQAYFGGDADTIKEFLTASYSSDIEVYGDPGEVENMDIRDIAGLDGLNGLSDTETYTLSRPFIVPGEDSLTYLSVTFAVEDGEWKVSGYWLEK